MTIVIEHHLVGLATDARLLIATERRVRRIQVITIHPHTPGFDTTGELMNLVHVP